MLDHKQSRGKDAFCLVMGKVFCLMRFFCPRLFGPDQDKDDFYQDRKASTVPKSVGRKEDFCQDETDSSRLGLTTYELAGNEGAFSLTAKVFCMVVILPLLIFLAWVAVWLNWAS